MLVSLHATRLHAGADVSGEPPEVARAFRDFLAAEERFRDGLLAGLRADPRTASAAAPEAVERAYALLSACDRLSLVLCAGLRAPREVAGVPLAGARGRADSHAGGGRSGAGTGRPLAVPRNGRRPRVGGAPAARHVPGRGGDAGGARRRPVGDVPDRAASGGRAALSGPGARARAAAG